MLIQGRYNFPMFRRCCCRGCLGSRVRFPLGGSQDCRIAGLRGCGILTANNSLLSDTCEMLCTAGGQRGRELPQAKEEQPKGSIPSFLTHTRGERWQIGKSSQSWQDLRAKGFAREIKRIIHAAKILYKEIYKLKEVYFICKAKIREIF